MENLTFEKFSDLMKKNIRFLVVCAIVGLIAGFLYSVILYKPAYESTAKLLIKDTEQTTFVSDLGTSSRISALARNTNPLLTQMELLSSEAFAEKIWSTISEKHQLDWKKSKGIERIQKAISVKNPVGTDIIEVTASWSDPEIARDIATESVNVYVSSNIDVAKQGILKSRQAINGKLTAAEDNLLAVRNQISEFRQQNSTVDLRVESENIVNQLTSIENRYQEIKSEESAELNKINALAQNLGIDWHEAIDSVALGHNPNFIEIQSRLGGLKEEFAGLATKYTMAHPSMITLKGRMDNLELQLTEQIKLTLGDTLQEESVIISDPVRTGMMESLVAGEATYRGLSAQAGILAKAIEELKQRKAEIPQKQLMLSNYLQQEANWAEIVNTLKAKQVETEIRESEVLSNISVVDAPTVPLFSAFPNRLQLIALFSIFATLFAVSSLILNEVTKNTYDDVEQMEKDLNLPVLGVVPWLDKEVYDEPNMMYALDESASFYSLAYQKIVSGMRIKGYNANEKVLAFTSSEFSKYRSTIIINAAYGLNKTGQSVVIVDADFRTPSISKEFGLEVNDKNSLGELLTNIARDLQNNGTFNREELSYYIHGLPKIRNLHVIPNTGNVTDPCEFLHSQAFAQLIQELKKTYDWVLVDVPPALAVPDATTVGSYVDGMVMVAGLDTNKSTLRKLQKQFENYRVPVFGIIAREIQTKEAASANEYIKQMISRMMPQNDELLIEEK